MSDGPLGLAGDAFWGEVGVTEPLIVARVAQGFRGILIDAPPRVSTTARETLPVLGWYARSLRENMAQDMETRTLVAASDLDTGRVAAGLALDMGKTPAPQDPPPVDFDPGEGVVFSSLELDARRQLDLSWQRGRYAITLMKDGVRSNTVETVLEPTLVGYQDPEVLRFLASRRVPPPRLRPRPVYPALGKTNLPSYREIEGSPEPPAKPGIALAYDPKPNRMLLQGAFRLPYRGGDCVTSMEVGDDDATAVLPVTLALTGGRIAGPILFEFGIPVYAPVDAEAGGVATGYFNVLLAHLKGVPARAGTYHLYLFSRDVVEGPLTIEVTGW